MKVNIEGIILETEQIQYITEVNKPSGNRQFDDSHFSNDDEKDWMEQFSVVFLNDKSITFYPYSKKGEYEWYTTEELIKLHDELVKVWSNNQSTIPKITI